MNIDECSDSRYCLADSNTQNLVGGASSSLHVCEVTNASRTLLLNTTTLQFEPCLLSFFGFRSSILPRIVSSSEVYGHVSPDVAGGYLAGVPIGGLVGDQQAALVGNKCLKEGEAKCTYGTGAFLLFCTGDEIVKSDHGLLSTVSVQIYHDDRLVVKFFQIAYQAGPHAKPVYALEGSSTSDSSFAFFDPIHNYMRVYAQFLLPEVLSSGFATPWGSLRMPQESTHLPLKRQTQAGCTLSLHFPAYWRLIGTPAQVAF